MNSKKRTTISKITPSFILYLYLFVYFVPFCFSRFLDVAGHPAMFVVVFIQMFLNCPFWPAWLFERYKMPMFALVSSGKSKFSVVPIPPANFIFKRIPAVLALVNSAPNHSNSLIVICTDLNGGCYGWWLVIKVYFNIFFIVTQINLQLINYCIAT